MGGLAYGLVCEWDTEPYVNAGFIHRGKGGKQGVFSGPTPSRPPKTRSTPVLRYMYQGMYIVSQLLRLTTDTYHAQRHTLTHTQRPGEWTPLPPGVDPLPRVGDPA